jgi:tetraacyldisaccharide 4'-kinase
MIKIARFIFLFPLSLLYGFVISFRNTLFDWKIIKSREFSLPVFSIGNITVGGTGKTPHTEYLANLLKDEYKVAVISRGYKRKTKGFRYVENDATTLEVGDEPLQIKTNLPEISVAVENRRVKGIKKLIEDMQRLNAIIMDDGFQHRYVKPGVSILLMDYYRPFTRDYLLPYGRLRDKIHEKRRANIIIVTKTPKDVKPINRRIISKSLKPYPYQEIFYTTYHYGMIKPVFRDIPASNPQITKNSMVLLVTGLADPGTFKQHIKNFTNNVVHLRYPDHYTYKNKDIQKIAKKFDHLEGDDKFILTTQKDAIRLREIEIDNEIRKRLFYIPINVQFLDDSEEDFKELIYRYMKDKKIGAMYK